MVDDFGARLRFWRRRSGLPQTQLAAQLSYHNTFISRIESGTRCAPMALAQRADELLGADGELTRLALAALAERQSTSAPDATDLPVLDDPTARPWPAESWPDWRARTNPAPVFVCPLHPTGDCASVVLHAADEVEHGGRPNLHGYLGWLAVAQTMSLHLVELDSLAPRVEAKARELLDVVSKAHLHAAADYAYLAGRLRGELGQTGAATVWLRRSAEWATASGNTPALCRSLGQLSLLSLFEGDLAAANRYAVAASAADGNRGWPAPHGLLCQARVAARAGDARQFHRRATQARTLLGRLRERDEWEASWFAGQRGETHVNAFLAAGERDLAARTGDPAPARRGARHAQLGLAALPAGHTPLRLVLTARRADCLARLGEQDEAMDTAHSVLTSAADCALPFVDTELRSMHGALRTCGVTLPDHHVRRAVRNHR